MPGIAYTKYLDIDPTGYVVHQPKLEPNVVSVLSKLIIVAEREFQYCKSSHNCFSLCCG